MQCGAATGLCSSYFHLRTQTQLILELHPLLSWRPRAPGRYTTTLSERSKQLLTKLTAAKLRSSADSGSSAIRIERSELMSHVVCLDGMRLRILVLNNVQGPSAGFSHLRSIHSATGRSVCSSVVSKVCLGSIDHVPFARGEQRNRPLQHCGSAPRAKLTDPHTKRGRISHEGWKEAIKEHFRVLKLWKGCKHSGRRADDAN
eukprot:6198799-Pleurochrysis_carterae.AAC.2